MLTIEDDELLFLIRRLQRDSEKDAMSKSGLTRIRVVLLKNKLWEEELSRKRSVAAKTGACGLVPAPQEKLPQAKGKKPQKRKQRQ